MVIDLDLLDVFHGPLNQSFPIQVLFRIQQLTDGGLGLGVLGGKDGAAVFIGQNGGFQGADLPGNGDDLFLS